jgi:CRP/FNR family cyclic AMP-dependent transcriptional regulator
MAILPTGWRHVRWARRSLQNERLGDMRRGRPMTDSMARAALGKGSLFSQATGDDLDDVLESAEEVSFEAGQIIFEQGDQRDGMFVILEGEVQIDVGGRFHRLRAGEFFGEMALLVPDARLATVRAMDPVRALHVSSGAFESFLLEHPRVAIGMLRALSLRLREVEQRIDAWMAP